MSDDVEIPETGEDWFKRATLDMREAGVVELEVDMRGKVWLNVDGVCRFRVNRVRMLVARTPIVTEILYDDETFSQQIAPHPTQL